MLALGTYVTCNFFFAMRTEFATRNSPPLSFASGASHRKFPQPRSLFPDKYVATITSRFTFAIPHGENAYAVRIPKCVT